MTDPAPTAFDRTILQTLELLDGQFAGLAKAFVRGEYALWLGSGISRERVAALNGVLSKIIEFLRQRATADETCPYKLALDQIVELAEPSDADRVGIAYDVDSANWPTRSILLKRLAGRYSAVLSISIADQNADFLLWDAADFRTTFANQDPDAEHLCVGILALEGVISSVVTANWDGLLEAAIAELGHPVDVFSICVRGNDFQGPATAAKLLKFHGCAIRAIADEPTYRPLLIARDAQIIDWAANNQFTAIKHALVALASQRRTLMIGMSAQDTNIQTLFSEAKQLATWPWNDAAPPHVFAEETLSQGQRTILTVSYGDDYHPNQADIVSRSRIGAFGKSLLGALVLSTLASKLISLARGITAPNFQLDDFNGLETGILRIRDLVANAPVANPTDLIKGIALHMPRVKSMLQEGRWNPAPQPYRAISNRHDAENDPNIDATGQREAASGLALLGLGQAANDWQLGMGNFPDGNAGAVYVRSAVGEARVIFVANSNVELNLFNDGTYNEDDDDIILLHSSPIVPRRQRSPSTSKGRSGKRSATHLDLSTMLAASTNLTDLRTRFRQGLGL